MKVIETRFKSLLFLLLAGTFLFSSTPSFGQSLEGKWIMNKESSKNSFLNVHVMQFTKDSLIIYNLDKRKKKAMAYHVKDNGINIGTDPIMVFRFVNPNRLRAKKDQSNESFDIVRLTPTKTKLTSAEIKKIEFFFSNDDKKRSFRFNKPNEGSKKIFKLEKIDSTYFLSQYSNNKRRKSAPIESVTPKKLVVYLSPEKSMILLGKDSDGNTTESNVGFSSIGELTTAEAIIGKWFYKRIEGRPSLSDCTKKTFFQFTEDLNLETKPYAENFSNGNCIAGSSINGTYEIVGDNKIKVTQNGQTETWKIQYLTKTELVVERDGRTLTLTKEQVEFSFAPSPKGSENSY